MGEGEAEEESEEKKGEAGPDQREYEEEEEEGDDGEGEPGGESGRRMTRCSFEIGDESKRFCVSRWRLLPLVLFFVFFDGEGAAGEAACRGTSMGADGVGRAGNSLLLDEGGTTEDGLAELAGLAFVLLCFGVPDWLASRAALYGNCSCCCGGGCFCLSFALFLLLDALLVGAPPGSSITNSRLRVLLF